MLIMILHVYKELQLYDVCFIRVVTLLLADINLGWDDTSFNITP